MKAANPYLNFNGNTEEAFNFYKSVFGGELSLVRFSEFGEGMGKLSEEDQNKIAHISLPIGNSNVLMASDSLESMGYPLTVGNNFYITLETESAGESDRLFNELSAGGKIVMPLQKTEWAEKYGMFADKYGTQWMINYTGNVSF